MEKLKYVWKVLLAVFGWLVKGWKWFVAHDTPLTFIYDVAGGIGLGWLVHLGLTHYIGHGLEFSAAHPAAGITVEAVAPLAAFAWPLAILFGGGLAVFLIYLDVKNIQKYGEL